jgi:hypothetical protein
MSIDLSKLNLRKEAVIDLKKRANIEHQKAQVILALDYSGSMTGLYKDGTVQDTLERILPLGLAFDDNGEVDFYIFENGCKKLPENINLYNIGGYINNKILGKYNMGGTNYAPIINQIVSDFGNPSTGWFSSKSEPASLPTYVIFITDGENSDKNAATKAIQEASKHGIFFQFIGIGNESFNFLKQLDTMTDRFIDNANFFKIPNLRNTSDDELYKLLLAEFPSWLNIARSNALIK